MSSRSRRIFLLFSRNEKRINNFFFFFFLKSYRDREYYSNREIGSVKRKLKAKDNSSGFESCRVDRDGVRLHGL